MVLEGSRVKCLYRADLGRSNRPHNRLLAAMDRDEFQRFVPHLTSVTFRLAEVVHQQGEPFEYVYFPNGGVCSIVAAFSNGSMVEVAATGDEGLVVPKSKRRSFSRSCADLAKRQAKGIAVLG